MYKQNSEFKSIQKKLMAAIAMVLVASIMVVSSSYAWFTLSTAPEVTGINTAVGSNGNLEIALRSDATGNGIGNTENGGVFPNANKYWGNLVDLSDESYHLNDITLLPSAIRADKVADEQITYQTNADGKYVDKDNNEITEDELETKGVIKERIPAQYQFTHMGGDVKSYIQVPTYGADGRVSGFNPNSFSDIYDTNAGGFPASESAHNYGVRAIGINSGLSAGDLLMLNARRAVSNAAGTAENGAVSSLRFDATKIANIAIKEQLNQTDYSEDVRNIRAAITNLQVITASLENAVKSAVVALGVSQGHTLTVDDVTITASDITTGSVTLVWSQAESGEKDTPEYKPAFDYEKYKTALIEANSKIAAMNTVLDNTSTALAPYEAAPATADADKLITVVTNIVNPNQILVNNKLIKDYGLIDLGTALLSNSAVVTITAGIYNDIALFVGNYTTPAKLHVEGDFQSVGTLNQDVSVNMETSATEPANGWYLDSTSAWLSTLKAGTGTGSGDKLMTDLYGYAIDLAFRTNAYGSNLMLQTDAADRIYTDAAEGSVTQGGGSYMEFTSGHATFTIDQMANLMRNIRVIFTDDTTGDIIAVAGLDVGSKRVERKDGDTQLYWQTTGAGATLAPDYTKDPTTTVTEFPAYEQAKFTAADGTESLLYKDDQGNLTTSATGNKPVFDIPNYEIVDVEGRTIRAKLYLYDFEIDNGKVTLKNVSAKQSITSLDQNVVKALTAVVYLDGNEVTNKDVAIGGKSMTGKLNLQFASDATLDPMDYTYGERLATPVISLDGNTLTVGKVENAEKYEIYVGNNKVGELTAEGDYDLTTATGELPAGTYTVTVIAKATGRTESLRSNAVQITVAPAAGG